MMSRNALLHWDLFLTRHARFIHTHVTHHGGYFFFFKKGIRRERELFLSKNNNTKIYFLFVCFDRVPIHKGSAKKYGIFKCLSRIRIFPLCHSKGSFSDLFSLVYFVSSSVCFLCVWGVRDLT